MGCHWLRKRKTHIHTYYNGRSKNGRYRKYSLRLRAPPDFEWRNANIFIKYQLSKLWWNSIFFREKLHFNEINIWSKFELYWWITNSWNIDLKEKLPLPYILCPIFYQQYTNTSCFQTKIQICNNLSLNLPIKIDCNAIYSSKSYTTRSSLIGI